jgi:hypothetical protein
MAPIMRQKALLLCCLAALPAAAQLRAGAAKRPITPDLDKHAPVWLAGFGNNRAATAIHDDLWVRCLALSAGPARPAVVCGLDVVGLFWEDVAAIRRRVPQAALVVAATHNHEAPDTLGLWGKTRAESGLDEAYNTLLAERTAEAAREALASLQPARARLAAVRPPGIEALFHDSRPPVVHDAEIVSLALDALNGRRIATLVNWASHPEALGSRNTRITADWPHFFYSRLERLAGGTAVFVNGALGGMQSPLGAKIVDPATGAPAPPDTFRFAEIVGLRAADEAHRSLENAPPAAITHIEYREALVPIPVANQGFLLASQAGLFKGRKPMHPQQSTTVPVGYLRLASGRRPVLEAATVPGELYPELSVGGVTCHPDADFPHAPAEPPVKPLFKAPFKMLFGIANDMIGYIIPKCQWDERAPFTFGASRPWYGEVNSPGPETAPRIVEALRDLAAGRPAARKKADKLY